MSRADDGTRWIDGKLFVLRSVHDDKEYARKIAADVRDGSTTCGCCGGPTGRDHYARVVRHNWTDVSGDGYDANRYAVFAFPKD